MTLGTHAAFGILAASVFPNDPLAAFSTGFISHFLLDTIPHWDYKLSSLRTDLNNPLETDMELGRSFFYDLMKIGTDVFVGVVVGSLLFYFLGGFNFWAPVFGAAGAVLPDFLQFVYMKWKHEPLISLQKFHLAVHAKRHIENPYSGISLQGFFLALAFIGFFFLRFL